MAKVTDLIANCYQQKVTFSIEVTPDVSTSELDSLSIEPLFYSITWHAKTHKNENLDIAPLRLARYLRNKNKEVLMHLSCDMLRKEFLLQLLDTFKEIKVCNLFVVLGEGFNPQSSDFQNSEELIKTIRNETGDYFCIGVAGLPDCSDEKLLQLKHKVDIGANFVLTQAFFESKIYENFIKRSKSAGINVPIIPGVFPFETYQQLSGFINMCKIKASQDILDYVKNQDQSEEIPGKKITQNLIKSIATGTKMKHFHLFSINRLSTVVSIVQPLL
ncbi:methylenetetrahydrofolate reductase [Ostrinia furnacalis]|uniref:methylenetetrahydrofolate reductase n=1 Tax=Ostrinia furnacalis TaxID=93504 RepID=UPI00103BE1D6|nr:methylenetetrahydrofolate reductase [Ostrinia furnacalis]